MSTDFTADSRILLHRRVSERVSKVAPFLSWEKDPYIIIRSDGTLTWMIDGYTTTDRIPYSAPVEGVGNYIRNPVKATVDAYNGDVRLWAVDAKDPLLLSLARIFPAAFTPLDSMPADLRAHMRYPEGMFSVQAQVYGTYHMTDPQVFYNKEDLWKVAERDVGSGGGGATVSPYFTVMKLAGVGAKEEFILMLPFTPSLKRNMIAWMSARSDPPHYRKLLLNRPQTVKEDWRIMQRGMTVYGRGALSHPDHGTITLQGWHRILMDTESTTPSMNNVAFLD